MSHGIESKESVKARNARPVRSAKRSVQGGQWMQQHPDRAKEICKKAYDKRKELGYYAALIQKAMDPITITSDNIILSSDYHIPFHDDDLLETMFDVARKNDTKHLAVIGDFWDCDAISFFNSTIESNSPNRITYAGEQEEVKKVLKRILNVFDVVYFSKGNHEDRLGKITGGALGMKQMFALVRPGINDEEWERRVKVTLDDHMLLNHCGQEWFLCHPRSFRKTNLSVVKELSALEEKNVFGGHGHQWAQGYSASGKYQVLDGGGMFDRASLKYARSTTCHSKMKSGFYLLKDGKVTPYEGDI